MADGTRVRLILDRSTLQRQLTGPDSQAVQLVARLQRRVLLNAKQRAPVDFGNLRNSHQGSPVVVTGSKVTMSVSANTDYAAAVHEGTRPHVIRPKNARVLSWVGGGGRVFAREVNHPGTPPRPWLRNALNEEGPRLGFG